MHGQKNNKLKKEYSYAFTTHLGHRGLLQGELQTA